MPPSLQIHPINTTENCPNKHFEPAFRRVFPLSSSDIPVPDSVVTHHTYTDISPNQCCSAVVHTVKAPLSAVWSVVRRFDNPLAYKQFLKSCDIVQGNGNDVGSLREVHVVSGIPAGYSRERLEILDDERHVMSFRVVGGDHRLRNYRSVTSLHSSGNDTVVVESYVVDVPEGNTKEETCLFVNTIVRCNLQSLGRVVQKIADTDTDTDRTSSSS